MANFDVGALLAKTNGIKFPAAQVASADANTLDDYEEGTFTPTITFGGAAVGVAYGPRTAAYTKIGNLVFFKLDLILTAKGSSTGAVRILGLPFTAAADVYSSVVVGYADALASISGHLGAIVTVSSTTIEVTHTGTGTLADLTNANFTNTSRMMIAGCYTAA